MGEFAATPPALSVIPTDDEAAHPVAALRSGYHAKRGLNIPALALSVALVGGVMVALIALGVVPVRKLDNHPMMVELEMEQAPPPPAKPPEPQPVKTVVAPAPVVAPPPLVAMPAPSIQVVTSPIPVPPVQAIHAPVAVPGPPALPAAVAPPVASVGDMSSNMLAAVPPSYPIESRRKREQGTVVLAVLLGTDGRVMDVSVSHSSGYARLDQAALRAVRGWRWSPTKRGGQAVMVRGLVQIPFILQDNGHGGGHKRHGRPRDDAPVADDATIA